MSQIAKLSIVEYERIVATGVFDGIHSRRIELIHGELREMNPIGPLHADVVNWLTEWSLDNMPRDSFHLRVQCPLKLERQDSEPQPDLAWVAKKRYAGQHPTPDEIHLVIEVSESSLTFDRSEKSDLYAAAGIPDYWIVNLLDRTVEVHRDPQGGRYASVRTFKSGQEVSPLAAPEVRLEVASLLGPSV